MDFKKFYEWYHRDRKLPKRVIDEKNFTYRNIIDVLDKYCRAKDMLDVGSGVGRLDFYLANKGKKITGVEISERAYKVALKSLKAFNLSKNIKFIRSDFLRCKISKTFNFIICSEVLEHLPHQDKVLKKIYKLTRKNGLFMLTVPSKNAPLYNFGSIESFDKRSGHLRRYTLDSATKLLTELGYKIIYKRRSEGILRNSLFVYKWGDFLVRTANRFPVISDLITFFDNISLTLFGESQIIVVAKKV